MGCRTELRDEVLLRAPRVASRAIRRTEGFVVAVGPDAAVVVVLDDDRVRTVVLIDGRRDVPSEREVTKKAARGAETHQASLVVVVAREGAVHDAAVRRDDRRRRGVVDRTSAA